jgi:CRP-like cAMP-binding protein
MTGIPEVWMDSPASTRVRVEIPGEAYVMTVDAFRDLVLEHRSFHQSTLAFGTGLLDRITRSPVCYRYHSVKQQCARWLLTNQARLGSEFVPVTHDHLAELLGVFRPTVTFALRELRDLGLVEVRRGRVHVLDRWGLEKQACPCYDSILALLRDGESETEHVWQHDGNSAQSYAAHAYSA